MTFRPIPPHRKNINGVIKPLTKAIEEVFGIREGDNGRPLGAFYTVNIINTKWEHLSGIWYRARNEEDIENRRPNRAVVEAFVASIQTGEEVILPSGRIVTWEEISDSEESELPPRL